MTTGIILAVLSIISCSAFLTKRIHDPKISRLLRLGHKILGLIIVLTAIVHMFLVWPLLQQRPLLMFVLGAVMTGCAILLMVSYLLRKRLKRRWIVIHRSLALIMLLCMVAHAVTGFYSLAEYKRKIAGISIGEIDAVSVADGIYTGVYDVQYIYAKVEVTVKNHEITNIRIMEHRNERGKRAEQIVNAVREEQSVKVDAISGATNSSRVILKAIENALEKNKFMHCYYCFN